MGIAIVRRTVTGLSLALGLMSGVQVTSAETLPDAIALSYATNPILQQQRALLRSLDETYVQARSAYRPNLGITATGTYNRSDPNARPGFETNSVDAALTASQPLYTGGRVSAAVRAAEAQVLAGRQTLRATEQQVLTQVISAYVDVRRDSQIVDIRRTNVDVIKAQLDETTARFDVGQLTRTDVATVRAQYAQARAALASALGQLKVSRAAYQLVVGQVPGQLDAEPALTGLPITVDQAFDTAERGNPTLLAAALTEQASQARVFAAKAARMPSISATASIDYGGRLAPFSDHTSQRGVMAGVTVTQPLFSGGLVSSQIRSALEQDAADRQGVEQARRTTIQAVSNAWNNILSVRANLTASLEQKTAATIAFEGTREEFRAGLRTVYEFVQAEQSVRDADLSVVTARHDQYLAEAALLAAIGRLDPKGLGATVTAYDPKANFDHVRRGYASVLDPVTDAVDRLSPHGSPPPLDPHLGIAPGSVKAGAGTDKDDRI